MFRKILFPLLALLGIAFAIFMIYWGARAPEEKPILFAPPESPYKHYVAGEGLIESLGDNTNISVPFTDLVAEVYVKAGQQVKKGQPLFKLDTRQFEADLRAALAELELAETELENQTKQFSFFEQLKDKSAVSQQEYIRAFYAKKEAQERVDVARANSERIKTTIERALIKAPGDGQVLQENAKVGEFANVNPFDREHLIIFGNTDKVQIRVNVAEEDAWRVIPNAPATAYVRGNASIEIPIEFSFIEPFIVPKQSLTGSDFERVDTRVLQIVYEFDKKEYPVYVGQLLDVYIEAKPSRYEKN